MVRLQERSKVARLEMEQTLYAGTIKVENLQEGLEVLLHPEAQANPKEPRQNPEVKTSQLISKQISSSRRAGQVIED